MNTAQQTKPSKPYPEFPLFPHATGRWVKKIKGKFVYFGPWSDPEGALRRYLDQRDDLFAGRTPRVASGGLDVRRLVNSFLTAKQRLVVTGELRQRTWDDYHSTCGRIVRAFGRDRQVESLGCPDFDALRTELARTRGPVALGNEVSRTKAVFRWGLEAGLIAQAVRFGPGFKPPARKVIRQARQAAGVRMFEAAEIRRMVKAARQPLEGMIWLGINAGLGNTDVANLPQKAIDWETGWVDYPRVKTAIQRRFWLWPEALASLREALVRRPAPRNRADDGLIFLTAYGNRWDRDSSSNPIAKAVGKLLLKLGIRRKGLGFYALRHTFATQADGLRDPVAVSSIMGHAPDGRDMSAVYREAIADARLRAVAEYVRAWLLAEQELDL